MKKTSKVFGALALSAALAMGAVPAFADTAATVGSMADFANGTDAAKPLNTGSTDVKVQAEVTQISATVPMQVSVVADIQGGQLRATPTGDLGVSTSEEGEPTATGYHIVNKSSVPIKVVNVKADESDPIKWVYSETALTAGAPYKLEGGTNTLGRINLTIAPNSDNLEMVTTTGTPIKKTATALAAANWGIPAKNGETPGMLGVKLGGTTSYVNTDTEINDTKAATAVKLTYTIAVNKVTA